MTMHVDDVKASHKLEETSAKFHTILESKCEEHERLKVGSFRKKKAKVDIEIMSLT